MTAQADLQLPITRSGKCNAIAFWFELELDEETQLSTSPYCQKVLRSAFLFLYSCLLAPMTFQSVSLCPLYPACGGVNGCKYYKHSADFHDSECSSTASAAISCEHRYVCLVCLPVSDCLSVCLSVCVRCRPTFICVLWQGPTWQQAVQWLSEEDVQAGSQLSLTAQHDTYGISFAWPSSSTKLPTSQLEDQSPVTNSASSTAVPSARDNNASDAEAGGSHSISSSTIDMSSSILNGFGNSDQLGHIHSNNVGCDSKEGSRDLPAGHDGVQSQQVDAPLPTSGSRPASAVPLMVRGLLYFDCSPVRRVCCFRGESHKPKLPALSLLSQCHVAMCRIQCGARHMTKCWSLTPS